MHVTIDGECMDGWRFGAAAESHSSERKLDLDFNMLERIFTSVRARRDGDKIHFLGNVVGGCADRERRRGKLSQVKSQRLVW